MNHLVADLYRWSWGRWRVSEALCKLLQWALVIYLNVEQRAHWLLIQERTNQLCHVIMMSLGSDWVRPIGLCHLEFHGRTLYLVLVCLAAFTLHGSSDPIPIFFPPMWHRSDMAHDRVSRKKSHGFRYSPISFRPHSYVELNQIWIGYVHLRLSCKRTDRIFPCKCDSLAVGMLETFRGTDIPVTNETSLVWVAEY